MNTCTVKNMNWMYIKFMTATTLRRKKKGWKPEKGNGLRKIRYYFYNISFLKIRS